MSRSGIFINHITLHTFYVGSTYLDTGWGSEWHITASGRWENWMQVRAIQIQKLIYLLGTFEITLILSFVNKLKTVYVLEICIVRSVIWKKI